MTYIGVKGKGYQQEKPADKNPVVKDDFD